MRYREGGDAVRAGLPEPHGIAEDRRPVLSAPALEAPVNRVEAVIVIRRRREGSPAAALTVARW